MNKCVSLIEMHISSRFRLVRTRPRIARMVGVLVTMRHVVHLNGLWRHDDRGKTSCNLAGVQKLGG
jgi:hypothetical protein